HPLPPPRSLSDAPGWRRRACRHPAPLVANSQRWRHTPPICREAVTANRGSQRNLVSRRGHRNLALHIVAGNDVDLSSQEILGGASHLHELEKTDGIVKINQQIHITVRRIISAGDTAEHRNIAPTQLGKPFGQFRRMRAYKTKRLGFYFSDETVSSSGEQ